MADAGEESEEEKPKRRQRSPFKSKSKSNLSDTGLEQTEAKETQYMSFVKRLSAADVSSETSKSHEIEVHIREKSADSIKFEESQMVIQIKKPTRIKSSKSCRHEEEILCECHSYNKPSIEKIEDTLKNLIQADKPTEPATDDIFHLTTTNEETAQKKQERVKIAEERVEVLPQANQETQLVPSMRDLKKILLDNYDARYANRIGVRDFEPTSVKSIGSLEFIPFEQIEDNYPK